MYFVSLLLSCKPLPEASDCRAQAGEQDALSNSLVQRAGHLSRTDALAENFEAHNLVALVAEGADSTNVAVNATTNGTTNVTTNATTTANETTAAATGLAPAPTPAATTTQAFTSAALQYLTQHGCHCKAAWSVEDETFFGCRDNTFSSEIVRGCVVEEGAEECPLAQPFGKENVLFDSCSILAYANVEEQVGRLQEATDEHCHCQPKWEYNDTIYQNCAFTPDADEPWCYVIEDDTLCHYVAGVGLGNQRWRYCEEYLTEIIVPIVVPVDILEGSASPSFRPVAVAFIFALMQFLQA